MSWRKAWAVAVYDLGLSPSDAYALTPSELGLLMDRHEERCRREELLFGTLAATVVNVQRTKKQKLIGPADIFPSLKRLQPKRKRKTDKEIFSILKASLGAKPE